MKPLILDSALGTELENRGEYLPSFKTSIWSAYTLINNPDVNTANSLLIDFLLLLPANTKTFFICYIILELTLVSSLIIFTTGHVLATFNNFVF